ncbi:MAG TPA: trypsin-like serine protease [Oligoflexia bacterium]|nr:trypsin-like serine protease [Oligoflexia bacterium]HMP48906.1 trypsin-like serine protease [Oligoflexia bacterium]
MNYFLSKKQPAKFQNFLVLFLVFLSFFLVSACSSDDDDSGSGSNNPGFSAGACSAFNFSRSKIVNGLTCSRSGNPSPLVRLEIRSLQGQGVCTGMVIDNDKILTAAHCLEGTILSVNVETDVGVRTGARFAVPSTYRTNPVSIDDVAIVFTNESIGIQPRPILVSQSPSVGETGFIGGFGENARGQLDSTPRAGKAIVTNVTSNHVTVRFEGDQAHPCFGDSGGPLVVERGGVRPIVGVVSQSDPSVRPDTFCRPGDITLYTNMRAPSVLSFLAQFAPNAGAL